MVNGSAVQAYIYLRISRDDEAKGYGVTRQEAAGRREAATLGWDVIDVLNENNTKASGKKPRPKYEAMLANLRDGKGNGVIGYAQDRVTRKIREAEDLLDLHDSMGVRIAIADAGELRLTNPDARANFRNSTVNGMREIDWVSKRVRDESIQRADRMRFHGPAPFGWRREVLAISTGGRVTETRDVLDPEEAGALQYAAKRLLAGVSLRQVTAELEASPWRPRRAAHWDRVLIRQYLVRDANAGVHVYKGQVSEAPGEWEPVYDAVTHGRVKQLLNDPARRSQDRGSAPAWLLSGIATCARCHTTVSINGGRNRRPAYRCNDCHQRHWVDDIDTYVAAMVQTQLNKPAGADMGPAAYAELEALYRRRDAIGLEKAQAAELVQAKAITLGQLVTLNAGYDQQVADLDAQIAQVLPSMAASVDLPQGFAKASLADQRAAVRALFSVIELSPEGKGRGRHRAPFQPSHVRLELAA